MYAQLRTSADYFRATHSLAALYIRTNGSVLTNGQWRLESPAVRRMRHPCYHGDIGPPLLYLVPPKYQFPSSSRLPARLSDKRSRASLDNRNSGVGRHRRTPCGHSLSAFRGYQQFSPCQDRSSRVLRPHRQTPRFGCALCTERFTDYGAIVPDHVNPRGMSGAWRDDHPEDIQAVHWWCNGEKASSRR